MDSKTPLKPKSRCYTIKAKYSLEKGYETSKPTIYDNKGVVVSNTERLPDYVKEQLEHLIKYNNAGK